MKRIIFWLLVTFFAGFSAHAQSRAKTWTPMTSIEHSFMDIPDSIQTSVYWYWISGNISKEGVIKDLEAMKKVGINRAFIGNIGLDDVPYSKIKMFSDEWWDILHTALKTATRLNIQIGIFNSPGWSQSGGPWVKPGQSMRYLTSSQLTVKGPLALNKKLEKPQANFQDVKVLAYPVTEGFGDDISNLDPTLSASQAIDSLGNIFDHNLKTALSLHRNKQYQLDISTKVAYTVRSITIITTREPAKLVGNIQAKVGNDYKTLTHFAIDRSNPAINTGFIPYGPAVISVPVTTATSFRVVFTATLGNAGIAELKLSGTPW